MAEIVRLRRVAQINDSSIELVSYPPLGKDWAQRFIKRHPQLGSVFGLSIEAARIKEASPEKLMHWFDEFKRVIEEENIRPEDIYNMDETGFSLGTLAQTRVVVDKTCGTRYRAAPGRQEWLTILECICGDGTVISPFVIFTGKTLSTDWIPANFDDSWRFSVNTRGWTSNDHALDWLRQSFEPMTREKANGRMRVLIYDGHGSHVRGEFLEHCNQNRIHPLLLPPHTSHLLQPLDVGIFGPVKKAMTSQLDRIVRTQIHKIQKHEFIESYYNARNISLTKHNIESAWRGAGLLPFCPSKVCRIASNLRTPTPPPSPIPEQSSMPFGNMNITSSPLEPDTLHSTNTALNDYLATPDSIKTPVRRYIKSLTRTSEVLSAEVAMITHECNAVKDVLQARKQYKRGKRLVLEDQISLSQPELRQRIIEIENEAKKKRGKKRKKSIKKDNTPSQTASEDEAEQVLLSEIEVMSY
jgi:hypothetical protein